MQLDQRIDIDLLDDVALAHNLGNGGDVLSELLLVQAGHGIPSASSASSDGPATSQPPPRSKGTC